MRVLVTGGCGFIGQYVARRLVAAGHTVVALDTARSRRCTSTPRRAGGPSPGDVLLGDVADAESWTSRPPGDRVDAVVHLAAETGTGQSMYEVDRYHRVNVEGTRLAAGSRSGTASRWSRSAHAPSTARAATVPRPPATSAPCCASHLREDDPHRPVSVYGETKSLGEVRASAGDRVPLTVIRPQNVVGPGQALHNPYTGVLAAFVARLREGRAAGGLRRRQPDPRLHARRRPRRAGRAGRWTTRPTDGPRVLNAGTGTRTTLLELAAYAVEGSPHADVARRAPRGHPGRRHRARLRRPDPAHEVGAPRPAWSSRDAVVAFVRWAWDRPGPRSQAWDDALGELERAAASPRDAE